MPTIQELLQETARRSGILPAQLGEPYQEPTGRLIHAFGEPRLLEPETKEEEIKRTIGDLLAEAEKAKKQKLERDITEMGGILEESPEYDMMGQRKGYTSPIGREQVEPAIGAVSGAGTLPAPPQQTPVPEQPQPGGMTPERRAMLLRTLSGLTSAGRRLADVPTLADVRYGAGTQRPFKPETEMLGEAKRIEGEQRERTEGVESPLVSAWNKIARERGLKEATTERQAAAGFDALGLGEKVKTLEAQRGKVVADIERQRGEALAAAEKAAEGKPLSDVQIKELTQIDNTIQALDKLIEQKPEFNTGPITNAFETVLNFIGAGETGFWNLSDKNAFKSRIHDMLAQYMKSISGVAISEKEAKRLQKAFPKASDDDDTFTKKGKAAVKSLKEKRKVFLENLQKQGKDISKLQKESSEDVVSGDTVDVVILKGKHKGKVLENQDRAKMEAEVKAGNVRIVGE